MNPDTGELHEVLKNEAGELARKDTGEKVPQHWPIFTLGEVYTIEGHEFRLRKVDNGKDLVFRPVKGRPHNYMETTE